MVLKWRNRDLVVNDSKVRFCIFFGFCFMVLNWLLNYIFIEDRKIGDRRKSFVIVVFFLFIRKRNVFLEFREDCYFYVIG